MSLYSWVSFTFFYCGSIVSLMQFYDIRKCNSACNSSRNLRIVSAWCNQQSHHSQSYITPSRALLCKISSLYFVSALGYTLTHILYIHVYCNTVRVTVNTTVHTYRKERFLLFNQNLLRNKNAHGSLASGQKLRTALTTASVRVARRVRRSLLTGENIVRCSAGLPQAWADLHQGLGVL